MEKKTCFCNLCQCQLQTDWSGKLTDGYSLHPCGPIGFEATELKLGRFAGWDRHLCDLCMNGVKNITGMLPGEK